MVAWLTGWIQEKIPLEGHSLPVNPFISEAYKVDLFRLVESKCRENGAVSLILNQETLATQVRLV